MMKYVIIQSLLLLAIICSIRVYEVSSTSEFSEKAAEDFLKCLNSESKRIKSKLVNAQLNFEYNRTDEARQQLYEAVEEELNDIRKRFLEVNQYPWETYKDPDVRRQMKLLSTIGPLALPPEEYYQLKKLKSDWKNIEETTPICDYSNKTDCSLHLNAGIKEKIRTSRNPEELEYLVAEWKKTTAPKLHKIFADYVKMCKRAAALNNVTNIEEHYLRNLEVPNFDKENVKREMEVMWEKVKPLYRELHAYVRRQLRNVYGEKLVPKDGTIPSYLLGCINNGNWLGIADEIIPYPSAPKFNLTESMLEKNITTLVIHQIAEDYFGSMNFSSLPNVWLDYDSNNKDCKSQVYDLGDTRGIRIKHCATGLPEDLFKALQLLTKGEYLELTKNQPYLYRAHPDQGLQQGVTGAIMLSVTTPAYLNKLGLYHGEERYEMRINRLFRQALEKVIPIPASLIQELQRLETFEEANEAEAENPSKWRDLREKLQGISTFVQDLNFDPGGIYNTYMSTPAVYNLVNDILQFQIYDSLCMDPVNIDSDIDLDKCSFYGSLSVGLKLRNTMSLGRSKPMPEVLEYLTGLNKLSPSSLIKYFDPLMKWLQEENARTGEHVGWTGSDYHESGTHRRRRKRSLEELNIPIDIPDAPPRELNIPNLLKERLKRDEPMEMIYGRERKSLNNRDKMGEDMNENLSEITYDSKVKRSASQATSLGKEKRKVNFSNRVMSPDALSHERKSNSAQTQKSNELRSLWGAKKGTNVEGQDETFHRIKGKQVSRKYAKRLIKRDNYDYLKRLSKKDTNGNGINSVETGNPSNVNAGNNKGRYSRRTGDKRRHASGNMYQDSNVRKEKEPEDGKDDRVSREAQWHSNTKKDISRLLHSFGFAVENDDKDKLKEMKKKLKGGGDVNGENNEYDEGKFRNNYETDWSEAELKKKAFNQKKERMTGEETAMNDMRYYQTGEQKYDSKALMAKYANAPYENRIGVDYNPLKSADVQVSNTEDDKSSNKVWSSGNAIQDSSGKSSAHFTSLNDKKDSFNPGAHSSGSLSADGKIVGKKEIVSIVGEGERSPFKGKLMEAAAEGRSSQVSLNNLNLDIPSIQMLLKSANLNNHGQKTSLNGGSDIINVKLKSDSQVFDLKSGQNKIEGANKEYKMNSLNTMVPLKDRTELKEEGDIGRGGRKSPFVIIVGQISPEMKERLIQSKGSQSMLKDSEKSLHQSNSYDIKKLDGKRNEMSEKIYVIPIEMNDQNSLTKSNHYTEHERDTGHDMNTERDQEEKIHLIGNSKITDKNGYYKSGKENPSEYIFSWNNNEKNKKIVKRSLRDSPDMSGLKVVRIAPMKESELEGLLGKSIDHAGLDDKNIKILFHDGLLNGESDLSSALSAARSAAAVSSASPGGMSASGSSAFSSSSGSSQADSQEAVAGGSAIGSPTSSLGSPPSSGSSSSLSNIASTVLSALAPKQAQSKGLTQQRQDLEEETEEGKSENTGANNMAMAKEQKDQDMSLLSNPNLRCNTCAVKKKTGSKSCPEEDQCKRVVECESSTRGDDACCKKIILTPCPPKCPPPCSPPCPPPCSSPCPCPCPGPCPPCPCPCPACPPCPPCPVPCPMPCPPCPTPCGPAPCCPSCPPSCPPPGPPPCPPPCCPTPCCPSCPSPCPCPPSCPCPGPCPCPCPPPPCCPPPSCCPPPPPCCSASPCCPSCPSPCPIPCQPCPPPCPLPCPSPCPPCPDCCSCSPSPAPCCSPCCKPEDLCCKKPSECSLVNCQFKITKAKKPHERLTIMIYDRINPPADLPEPYDALAVISEVLQRIQCSNQKPCAQLTEEDPDYPANDNTDQLKSPSQAQISEKGKTQEVSGEMPIFGGDSPEEEEADENSQTNSDDDKLQHREKVTPAIDQLTVFNKEKLKPVLIELRKIDDLVKKRSETTL